MAASTFIAATQSGSGGTSYVSAAFTPTAGSLLVVFVKGKDTRAAGSLASSVGGKTFTEITNRDYGSADRVYAYVADQTSSATSQTVTFDCTGDTSTGSQIAIYEVTGLTRVGLSAIKQAIAGNGASGIAAATTFVASALTGNPTLWFAAQNSNANFTVPSGWTEDFDTGSATTRIEVAHRDSGFTGTGISTGNTASGAWGAIAVELDTSAAGGGGSTAANTADATYTALAIGHTKSKAIGTAVAVYTAPSVGSGSALGIGIASDSYTALPIGHRKAKAIGIATSAHTALAVGFGNSTPVGIASSAHTALPIGHKKSRAIGTALSVHFALPLVLPAVPRLDLTVDQVVRPYTPKPLPSIGKQFDPTTKYLLDELKRMQSTINQLVQASPLAADTEPTSPRRGMVRYAVEPWDPLGTGFEGYVVYDGTTWTAL